MGGVGVGVGAGFGAGPVSHAQYAVAAPGWVLHCDDPSHISLLQGFVDVVPVP